MTVLKAKIHPVLAQAIEFTETYKQHQDDHPALREAAVLKTQYPALMGPIESDHMFAGTKAEGRVTYVGSIWFTMMASERGPSKQGGYCFDFGALEKYDFTPEEQEIVKELKDFWREEYTCAKIQARLDERHKRYACGPRHMLGGGEACGFCVAVDLDRLLQRGIPGLVADVERREEKARKKGEDLEFLQGLRGALEVVIDVCRHYENQAREMIDAAKDTKDAARLQRIADSLSAIVERKPETLHEAMQLLWLYDLLVSGRHIEGWRIDVALGDFFANDIDSGRLSEEEATQMVLGLWHMWNHSGDPAVCRMIIGGRGRRNPENADRFCMAAMEASLRNHGRLPQLSLRFHKDQDPALMKKAFDVIGDGCVFPMLYNDDVNVPGVAQALNVPESEAEYYNPLGCGEYMLAAKSPSLLNFGWSAPKMLEAALRGGVDDTGRELGPPCPPIDDSSTLEDLMANLKIQIDFAADLAAEIHARNAKIAGSECAFLLTSLLTDDCLERNQSLLDGGVRYVGGCIMGHGFTNAADGLHAIRKLVYEDKTVTISELKEALTNDFVGYEDLHKRLLEMPKFGNDDDAVDHEVADLWRMISNGFKEAGERHGLDFLTVSSVNPGGYFMGRQCGAGPDGRRNGQPFAIGNAPTAGSDTKGLTALFNSLSKIDPVNGGAASNIKLAKSLFTDQRAKLESLFTVYWKRGGMQASVSVVDQEELQDAMKHPEKYPHLLVRLGGWTAKFVDLERHQQEEIIRRSIY
ncbi:MAG: pyruvate formate lyase family protein [Candidatus Sumerlaeota bacterium]